MPYLTILNDKPTGPSIEVPSTASIYDLTYLFKWVVDNYLKDQINNLPTMDLYLHKIDMMLSAEEKKNEDPV